MDLYDLYTTLLRRGMPDRPMLRPRKASDIVDFYVWQMVPMADSDRIRDGKLCCPSCHEVTCECEPRDIDEQDAHDLLTTHALLWLFLAAPNMILTCDESGWSVAKLTQTFDEPSDRIIETEVVCDGPLPLLDAILAATAHLEK